MSRNSPEIRQVTSTRGRPNTAGGSTSTPVTRPVPASHTGRHPISASPCAISSPPVRRLALPQRSITSARGQSPCSCANRRSASSAPALPQRIGRPRRQRPRIRRVEVPPRRQHVGPPARRRPRRPRRHVPPVERRRAAPPAPPPRTPAARPPPRRARPKTCSPSLTARSLRSHSQASILTSARSGSSPAATPASPASPLSAASSTISRASRSRRRRSSPSAWAYSSTSRSSARAPSLSPAASSGGVRCPSVTAAIRRFACAASPGLLTMNG